MGTLLEFIFDNLFFVIIIVGALFNIFSRFSKEGEKKAQPQKKPFLEELEDVFSEILPEEEEQQKKKGQQAQEVEAEVHPAVTTIEEDRYVNPFEKQREELEQLLERERRVFERAETIQKVAEQTNERPLLNVKEIGKDEIVKGVIWSEVLGKPRALKRHSPFNNRLR